MRSLTIARFAFGANGTFGRLSVSGTDFGCFTLEPRSFPWVPENARDISCIPVGTYPVELGVYHRGTEDPGDDYPCLVIPDGEVRDRGPGVKIHGGNTLRHTKGCPLVGDSIGFLKGRPAVLNSRKTLAKLLEVFGDGPGVLRVEELRDA
jgi:hypothetical protein